MSDAVRVNLMSKLKRNPLRQQLIGHDFFRRIRSESYSRQQSAIFIGQWWHPLHYFPTFLARSVAQFPDIQSKSAAARILNQETGEGNPNRAHEVIYVESMRLAGFDLQETTEMPPFAETEALVASYAEAAQERFSALGFIFATEVADLAMVSGIGESVRRTTGVRDLEWVAIHVEQEPDHVEQADNSLTQEFSESEEIAILASAEQMWGRWIAFFDRLDREVFATSLVSAS